MGVLGTKGVLIVGVRKRLETVRVVEVLGAVLLLLLLFVLELKVEFEMLL